MVVSLWLLSVAAVVAVTMIAVGPVDGRVDYECVYGPILPLEDSNGEVHYFCPTEMDPPFMEKGDYIVAVAPSGKCYECVCELELGLACCEITCP